MMNNYRFPVYYFLVGLVIILGVFFLTSGCKSNENPDPIKQGGKNFSYSAPPESVVSIIR